MQSKADNPGFSVHKWASEGLGIQAWAWIAAVATFGVGDLATTMVGLQFQSVVESHPVASSMLGEYGFFFLFVLKAVAFLVTLAIWSNAPRSWRLGVPVGLTVFGSLVVLSNLFVILSVAL